MIHNFIKYHVQIQLFRWFQHPVKAGSLPLFMSSQGRLRLVRRSGPWVPTIWTRPSLTRRRICMLSVQRTVIWMGKKQESVGDVPCGNTSLPGWLWSRSVHHEEYYIQSWGGGWCMPNQNKEALCLPCCACWCSVQGCGGGIEPSLDFFRAFFEINIFVFIIVYRVVWYATSNRA